MWSNEDVSALESWHEAHSKPCTECRERWLVEQMTDRLGALYCPDCNSEQPKVLPVQVAGVDEAKRLRAEMEEINSALCAHGLMQRQQLRVIDHAKTQWGRP